MAKALIDESILSDIVDEINILTGENIKYKDKELAEAIKNKLIAKNK